MNPRKPRPDAPPPPTDPSPLIAVTPTTPGGTVTARRAGGLQDLSLCVSPRTVPVARALQNLAKAINIAFQSDFLENQLELVYSAARVRKGCVEVMHRDYIVLGDGVFASVGKAVRSFTLTLQGPDPGSPEGKEWLAQHGRSSVRGLLDFIGRKLNLVREYEDQAPVLVEQMLDRLEAARMVSGWDRDEWELTTRFIGLDLVLKPLPADAPKAAPARAVPAKRRKR